MVPGTQHPGARTASKQERALHPLVNAVGETQAPGHTDAPLAHLGFVVQFVDEMFIKSGDYSAISLTSVK